MKTNKLIPAVVSGLLLFSAIPVQAVSSDDLQNMTVEELTDISSSAAVQARSLLLAELLEQPVHVVETNVTDTTDERFSTSYETGILLPVILNDSDTEIHDITVCFAAWNEAGEPVTLQSSLSAYAPGCMPSIRLEGAVLAPGETLNAEGTDTYRLFPFDITAPVVNARAIVVSYTDDKEQTWKNPLLDSWTKAYLGAYSEEQEITEEPAEEVKEEEAEAPVEEAAEEAGVPAEETAEMPAEETAPAEEAAEAPAEEAAEAPAGEATEETAEKPASPTDDKAYVDWMYVYNVQAALNELGYNCGTPDGLAGELTYQSMQKYQEEHGLPVTRTITGRLLDSLGIEHPDS